MKTTEEIISENPVGVKWLSEEELTTIFDAMELKINAKSFWSIDQETWWKEAFQKVKNSAFGIEEELEDESLSD
jgi:hypothetical protein